MGKLHFPPQASRSSIARFYDSVAWCFKTQTKLPTMKAIELTPGQFSIPGQNICDITALSNTSPRGMNVKERLTTVTLSHENFFLQVRAFLQSYRYTNAMKLVIAYLSSQ